MEKSSIPGWENSIYRSLEVGICLICVWNKEAANTLSWVRIRCYRKRWGQSGQGEVSRMHMALWTILRTFVFSLCERWDLEIVSSWVQFGVQRVVWAVIINLRVISVYVEFKAMKWGEEKFTPIFRNGQRDEEKLLMKAAEWPEG